ncbi:MAG TPA: hypothetical protein VML75_00065 [Kofleriaceae bacterium]|nr:hypothetical protein [Kofleriaceae bacterium]
MSSELDRLRALVPDAVMEVCRRLQEAGYEAWTVGGAVRDALLERPIGDWDVATSATPEQVQARFHRTIPTGLQHGTVTVVLGRGEDRHAVEVTTFRGEGAYSDARRPDSVTFGVPLDQDLARRDLVINAMAYDPIGHRLHDPFGGAADLTARRIRAVGVAEDRFTEDGLRVMRAVRFAAQLQFELDADTEAGIGPALPSLARVSMERVRDELLKLLRAPRPSVGLAIAQRVGIFEVVVPELHLPGTPAATERWQHTERRVDAAAAAAAAIEVRLATLLEGWVEPGGAEALMRRLKSSNEERQLVVDLIARAQAWRVGGGAAIEDPALRRMLGELGRATVPALLDLWRADRVTLSSTEAALLDVVIARVAAILERGDALTVRDLAIGGGDLMSSMGIAPGRIVGRILEQLLTEVLVDPTANRREELLARAVALHASMTTPDA